jgi:hypothetical protein
MTASEKRGEERPAAVGGPYKGRKEKRGGVKPPLHV